MRCNDVLQEAGSGGCGGGIEGGVGGSGDSSISSLLFSRRIVGSFDCVIS